jgi:hypothetical protein
MENSEKERHITIADIEKLKYGEKRIFRCVDKKYPPIILNYSHLINLIGRIQWTKGFPPKEFEFHIECVPNFWFPLSGGKLPNFNVPGIFNLTDFKTDWKDYPKNTRIGWRGPIILETKGVLSLH